MRENMKFNVVLGNPPYNNDIYLDFVQLGFKLSSEYTLMITPAKWQAKGGSKNELFRETIVPHMSKIVYYPECKDVFDIAIAGGISYYSVDKVKHVGEHRLKIVCSEVKILETDTIVGEAIPLVNHTIRNIIDKVSLNMGCDLGSKLGFNQGLYLRYADNTYISTTRKDNNCVGDLGSKLGFNRGLYLRDADNTYISTTRKDNMLPVICGDNNCVGYFPMDHLRSRQYLDKYKVVMSCMDGGVFKNNTISGIHPKFVVKPYEIHKATQETLMAFDTELEANSFKSYLDSKLVKFLNCMSFVQSKPCSEHWRFVPDPGVFDHIFTDQELYEKYNLTQEEINIIESVIKERKSKN